MTEYIVVQYTSTCAVFTFRTKIIKVICVNE